MVVQLQDIILSIFGYMGDFKGCLKVCFEPSLNHVGKRSK